MSWIPTTPAEREKMLAAIGVTSVDDLFATIPEAVRLKTWDLPSGKSEKFRSTVAVGLARLI